MKDFLSLLTKEELLDCYNQMREQCFNKDKLNEQQLSQIHISNNANVIKLRDLNEKDEICLLFFNNSVFSGQGDYEKAHGTNLVLKRFLYKKYGNEFLMEYIEERLMYKQFHLQANNLGIKEFRKDLEEFTCNKM